MDKDLKQILIDLCIALIGSFATILTPEQQKWIPIIFSAFFFILATIYVIKYLRKYWARKFFISFDKDSALNHAREIYNTAKINGGIIYSSHIYPFERLRPDTLTDILKDAEQSVTFHRLVFTDDPISLDKIARETLSIQGKNINVELLIPYFISLTPKFLWYILPRINFCSYFDPLNKISITTIGIFRIYTEQNIYQSNGQIKPTRVIF